MTMHNPLGTDEDYSAYGLVRQRRSIRAFLPVMGLLLIVCFGAIAWVLGPLLYNAFGSNLGMPADWGPVVLGVTIFVVLLFLSYVLYAMFVPRRAKGISEHDLEKERVAREQMRRAMRKNKRKVNIERHRAREEQEKRSKR
jgi:type VI protein secretion system component VasK